MSLADLEARRKSFEGGTIERVGNGLVRAVISNLVVATGPGWRRLKIYVSGEAERDDQGQWFSRSPENKDPFLDVPVDTLKFIWERDVDEASAFPNRLKLQTTCKPHDQYNFTLFPKNDPEALTINQLINRLPRPFSAEIRKQLE